MKRRTWCHICPVRQRQCPMSAVALVGWCLLLSSSSLESRSRGWPERSSGKEPSVGTTSRIFSREGSRDPLVADLFRMVRLVVLIFCFQSLWRFYQCMEVLSKIARRSVTGTRCLLLQLVSAVLVWVPWKWVEIRLHESHYQRLATWTTSR